MVGIYQWCILFIGLILGSVYCIKYSTFIEKKLSTFIFLGSFLSFVVTLLFSINSKPIVALLLSVFVGFFGQIKNIPQQTVIQTSVSKEQLSTVYTSLRCYRDWNLWCWLSCYGVISRFVGD